MTDIFLCPGCGDDLIATTDNQGKPLWSCGECGYTDAPLVREMLGWKSAVERGGWQR